MRSPSKSGVNLTYVSNIYRNTTHKRYELCYSSDMFELSDLIKYRNSVFPFKKTKQKVMFSFSFSFCILLCCFSFFSCSQKRIFFCSSFSHMKRSQTTWLNYFPPFLIISLCVFFLCCCCFYECQIAFCSFRGHTH